MLRRLFFAVLIVGAGLALINIGSLQAVTESGDINISATVPTPPPSTPPTIDEPQPGTVFNSKHITVRGRCTPGLIVKVFSNNVFVGSTVCRENGTYSLPIDLFLDRNDLVARQYDSLNQPSPDSPVVTVYYIPDSERPIIPGDDRRDKPPSIAHFQLIIDYDYTVQGIFAGQSFRLPVKFIGGTGPYTVTIDWGDGSSNQFSRASTDPFDTNYTYTKPGNYIVSIRVTDSSGQEAYLQFVVIVHGEPQPSRELHFFGRTISRDLTFLIILFGLLLTAASFMAGKYLFRKKTVDNKT